MSGPLIVVSVAYLVAASGIMIWRGIAVSPDYLLLVLVPVAVTSGRFLRFLGDWIPFVALVLGYEGMRSVASTTGIGPHVGDIASAETWLFGGHLPTAVVQSWVDDRGWTGGVDYGATVVYFAHFVLPVAVGLTLWLSDRQQFLTFVVALVGMSFAAFVVYLLAPTAPPWYAQDHGVLSSANGFRHIVGTTIPDALSPYYTSLNPNPTAALPSLHAAYPILAALALWPVFRRAAVASLAWAIVVWSSIVYLGEHYVVDIVAGSALAVLAWVVVQRLVVPRVAVLRPPVRAPAEVGAI